MTIGKFNYKKWLTENKHGEANFNYINEQNTPTSGVFQYVARGGCSPCTEVGSYALSGSYNWTVPEVNFSSIDTSENMDGTNNIPSFLKCLPEVPAPIITLNLTLTDDPTPFQANNFPPATIAQYGGQLNYSNYGIDSWDDSWGYNIRRIDTFSAQQYLEEDYDCGMFPIFNAACCNPDSENYGLTDTGENVSILDNFPSFLEGVFCDDSICGSQEIDYTSVEDYFNNPTGFCADNPDVEYDAYWFITETDMCEQCQNDPIQNAAIQCCCCPGYDGLPQQAIDYYAESNITFTAWGGPNQCDGSTLPLISTDTGSIIPTGSINIDNETTSSFATGSVTASGQPAPQGLPTLPTMGSRPDKLKRSKDKPESDPSAGLTSLDFFDKFDKTKEKRLNRRK